MDLTGLIIIAIFAALYFATREKKEQLKYWPEISLVGIGVGMGLVIGAIWSYLIIANLAASYGA